MGGPRPYLLRMNEPASPVQWLPDGTPRSTRFNDVYRSQGLDGLGGWAQARHVFLRGCGLLPGQTCRSS